jgi:hypothetical protein
MNSYARKRKYTGSYGPSYAVRRFSARRRANGAFSKIPRLLSAPRFPAAFGDQPIRKYAKLKFCHHQYLAGPGVGSIIVREYLANGMYQPLYGTVTHQPYGFDQLMNQYNHYTVLKSTCKVELMSAEHYLDLIMVGSVYNEQGVVTAAHAAGTGVNFDAIREIPNTSKDVTVVIGEYGEDKRSFTMHCDILKQFGKTSQTIMGDSLLQGSATTNPTEDAYYSICIYQPHNESKSAVSFNIKTEIVYYAVFTEPKWFTQS